MIYFDSSHHACRIDLRCFSGRIFSESNGLASENGPKSSLVLMKSISFRLDNKPDLISELRLKSSASDDELLLAAWTKWHENMPTHLRGSFAFCISDMSRSCVYIARDPLGISPLYYNISDSIFVAGSSSKKVRAGAEYDVALDDTMLSDFIVGRFVDKERTFFEGVFRLPPGSWKKITQDGAVTEQYWSPLQDFNCDITDDPSAAFRTLFDRSVRNCFEKEATAIMISGGMDSSSIAGALKGQGISGRDIPSISMTYYNTDNWYDAPFIKSMTEALGEKPVEIPCDFHDPLQDIDRWLEVMDGPYLPLGQSVGSLPYELAGKMGLKFVLSGHGGDEVVSYGFGRLNELAMDGKWWTLWRECDAASSLYHTSRLQIFKRYLSHLKLFRIVVRMKRKLSTRFRKTEHQQSEYIGLNCLSEDLAEKVGSPRYSNPNAASRLNHTELDIHRENLDSAVQPLALEVEALCSEELGVESRMPFCDQELVEFCLSLPSEWKLNNGFSRYIVRKAMSGDVPEPILARKDKFSFSGSFRTGLIKGRRRVLELSDPVGNDIASYFNMVSVKKVRQKLIDTPEQVSHLEAYFIWRVAVVSMWLQIVKRDVSKSVSFVQVQ